MGESIMKQIVDLIKRHKGCIKHAVDYWYQLFGALSFSICTGEGIPYHHIETALKNSSEPYGLTGEKISSEQPKSDGIFIEYMWEIDLDEARLGMGTMYTGVVHRYWSWKKLYVMGVEESVENAEGWCKERVSIKYDIIYGLIVMQAHVRGFIARRKELQPPNGIFYLKAKKTFESNIA
jgi:hypothetical protein